jgi:hypothetical protein
MTRVLFCSGNPRARERHEAFDCGHASPRIRLDLLDRARVTLRGTEFEIVLTVSDDGPVFDPASPKCAPGKGAGVEQRIPHPREEMEGYEEAYSTR